MNFLRKKIDNYFNSLLEQKTITVMCWDSQTAWRNSFLFRITVLSANWFLN